MGLRKKLAIGFASLLSFISCAPDSENRDDARHFINGITNPSTLPYPDYPPYNIEEPPTGNGKYPVEVIAWDGVDNLEALVNGNGFKEGNWTTIHPTSNQSIVYDGVVNGIILQFDHEIVGNNHEGISGDDLSVTFINDAFDMKKNYFFGLYLVLPPTIIWKQNGKAIQFDGWKYTFYKISEVDVYGGFNHSFIFDVEPAVRDSGRGSNLIAIMNPGVNPIKVQSITDRHY